MAKKSELKWYLVEDGLVWTYDTEQDLLDDLGDRHLGRMEYFHGIRKTLKIELGDSFEESLDI